MKELTQVLSSLGVPVSHPPYLGKEPAYVVYTLINNAHEDWASGEVITEETVWSVDLFTKTNYKPLAEKIKSLLREAGYAVSEGPETFEPDTQFYHVNFDARIWDDAGIYAEVNP